MVSKNELGAGESVVIHARTHWKALLGPIVAFILVCFVAGLLTGLAVPQAPPNAQFWLNLAIWVLAGVGIIVVTVAPFLRWLTTTYTVTNRRLITRRGIFTQNGHDLPLVRINNVSYERSVLDRMLGCGTVTLMTAAEQPITLPDVPDVTRVHLQLSELMLDALGSERREDH